MSICFCVQFNRYRLSYVYLIICQQKKKVVTIVFSIALTYWIKLFYIYLEKKSHLQSYYGYPSLMFYNFSKIQRLISKRLNDFKNYKLEMTWKKMFFF